MGTHPIFESDFDCLTDFEMAKHHPDLIFCRKQAGVAIGRLCDKCDGRCVICDSYVRPSTLVRICDECNYGSFQGRCVICGGLGCLTRTTVGNAPSWRRIATDVPKSSTLDRPKPIFSTKGRNSASKRLFSTFFH